MRLCSGARLLAGTFLVATATLGAGASCGSRTGLPLDEIETDAEGDLGATTPDRFAPREAAAEDRARPGDTFVPEDTSPDVGLDAIDDLPFLDVNRPDVILFNPCPDAEATLIYVMGINNELYSFNPATATFTSIGALDCPSSKGSPFSMAVDREGTAYVVFSEASTAPGGNAQIATGLFRVSTKTAACTATTYDPARYGRDTFGMGFVANVTDGGEGGPGGDTLYVARDVGGIYVNAQLDFIDTTTFHLHRVAPFSPSAPAAELTGTGDGRLYAFSPSKSPGGSFIAQIDPVTAELVGADPLPGIYRGRGWAFGFWGGSFYLFTGTGDRMTTVVNRFDPTDGSDVIVATLTSDTIVGAGVSTCAPLD